jgi:3-dehydrotetronate 4-kinase
MLTRDKPLIFGAIADDYTGGSDLAGMLSERGVRTVQVLGPQPDSFVAGLEGYEALVVSLKSRSLPAPEACALSLQALRQLQQLGARQIQFKYCSTFDSTAGGNIGPVTQALMAALGIDFTVAVPALPVNGRTQYLGHLFVASQLLSESSMRYHPLTPMTDSNLVRHLQSQTSKRVGLLSYPVVKAGAESVQAEIAQLKAVKISIALVDAICDEDLETIAEAIAEFPFITGGSGVAGKLPSAWARRGWFQPQPQSQRGEEVSAAPVLILSGSCSAATLEQLRHLQEAGCPILPLPALSLLTQGSGSVVEHLARVAQETLGREGWVAISSSAPPTEREALLRGAQECGCPPARLAAQIEDALGIIAHCMVDDKLVRRMIVAGGETSGAVMQALKIQALEIGEIIDPGIPSLKSVGGRPLTLALKSGNFGSPQFFVKAVEALRRS